VAGQTYCLQKLERVTTTVNVPKTLLKCQSLSDQGSLEREPFGTIRLDKLKPSDVEALVLAMRASTESAKPTNDDTVPQPIRALSDSTIRQTYTVLQAALDGAVRDGLLAKESCSRCEASGHRPP